MVDGDLTNKISVREDVQVKIGGMEESEQAAEKHQTRVGFQDDHVKLIFAQVEAGHAHDLLRGHRLHLGYEFCRRNPGPRQQALGDEVG